MPEAQHRASWVPDKRPAVYSYLRAPQPDEIELGLWRKEIQQFCQAQGYRLELGFVEQMVEMGEALLARDVNAAWW